MPKVFLLIILLILTYGCDTKKSSDPELDNFAQLLTGKFSSKKQSKQELDYSAVSLVNAPIWKNRAEHWFYQELYDEKNNAAIYNQRILRIRRVDSLTISSTSYVIPNRKKYVNAWKDVSIFNLLSIDSLKIREGCDVFFKKKTSTIYQGKTKKGTCSSSFSKKISFTTSNIVISRNKISSWDRGYDNKGKQVWGKIQGPYNFIRVLED
ncbi:CpeT/CpcT family [Aquimarina amphilecti]|uniref:CpeT/CpcT family n=1 Tax=Aquimarina amphilecti TaxID=1038014 RepID=A0A1H7UJS2_AQUAM|nr:chromophore lyase CpcT/CpeT [Aquimarina amphilecti]SEL97310.1 CpeT/CpcT family [Aquimarina amphilecti]